ncbi:nuclear pore complex protein Nup153 isoform X2 [Toxorhynchites rutilus septentrionalis]|uniref:nuclear pore complex protein Nup153 isoform X2 n=1 Tax=Toxorhynchites rutilus septentrionalis TaxID=329112 RepID=UPI00247A9EAB|nr:nuclear pore complex protein Nup153 isoform X2 [Toxorhynchites rutilus septentrionalis]
MFQARSRPSSRSSEDSPSPSQSSPMAAAAAAAASSAALNTSTGSNLDDDPNSSIIGKVRSRVSSILPDALSKWFSPAAVKRPRDSDSRQIGYGGGGGETAPAGRNGNLTRNHRRHSTSSDADENPSESGGRRQYHQQEEDEEDEDEEHAPPTRKKKRLEESFNNSLTDFNDDMGIQAGPSGLNISAIDRRSSLPAGMHLQRRAIRNTFSASTPATSPQQGGVVLGDRPLHSIQQRTSLIGYGNRTTAPFNFGGETTSAASSIKTTPIGEEPEPEEQEEDLNESVSASIRRRRGIRDVSNRKRLNIQPISSVDRSISEPPLRIFGATVSAHVLSQGSSSDNLIEEEQDQENRQQQQQQPEATNPSSQEDNARYKTLSNGNMNESASESSSVSNLNLSQSEQHQQQQLLQAESRRMSGFMGNNRSKRHRVGGSTGDLCFSSHLETEKSLFSAKNAGRAGKPTFNASLYGSSFSLGSTNSSLFASSPFYNGRTMYGGASAYNARREKRQKALRVPVQIRPSSSLSNFSSSNASIASDTSALSNTAKRILEIMNQCSGPLNEARKLGSSLSLNSTLASPKVPGLVQARKRFNEEDLNTSRSIRMSSPRTPYSRPQSATGNSASSVNKPPIAELQIPSMSQLLHMKRLQTNTESVRRVATQGTASTVLNEPSEYKLPTESDDTNNNVKHTSKMRNKLHRVREELHSDRSNSTPMPQLNLPEVQLAGLKSVPKFDMLPAAVASSNNTGGPNGSSKWRITTATGEKTSVLGTKSSSKDSSKSNAMPSSLSASTTDSVYKFPAPTKLNSSLAVTLDDKEPPQKSFKFSNPEPIEAPKSNPPKLGSFQFNPETAKPKAAVAVTSSSIVPAASAPLPLKSGSCLDALKGPAVIPELKTGSCLEALSATKPASAPSSSLPGFGDSFKLAGSNKWECDACMVRNDPDKTKCMACESPKPGVKGSAPVPPKSSFSFGAAAAPTPVSASNSVPAGSDAGFKALIAQQSSKWECSDCMTRNDLNKLKCMCCEKPKPGSAVTPAPKAEVPAAIKSMFSMPNTSIAVMPATKASSDQGFKTLVAQQAANKWECSTCMTRNEAARSKCVCCEQAKPGSSPVDVPSFSFGSKSAENSSGGTAKFSFGVPQSADSSSSSKDTPKSGFTFGVPTGSSASTSVTFGSSATTSPAPAAVGGGFSFGVKPAVPASGDTTDSCKANEKKEESKPTPVFGSGGFSFGAKPTTNEVKKAEAVTSATSTGGFSFGSKSTTDSPTVGGFSFGKPAESSSIVSTTAAPSASDNSSKPAAAPITFGSLASSAAKSTASSSFGSAGSNTVSAESKPPAGTGVFSFGSPKTTVSTPLAGTPSEKNESTAAPTVAVFGGAQKPTVPSVTPSFSFGAAANNSSTSSSKPAAVSAPAFNFGASAAKPAEVPANASTTVAATNAPVAAAPTFVFGQQSSQQANKVVPSFGAGASSTAASTEKPTFGTFGASAAAPAPTGNSLFGASVNATGSSGFGFGNSATSAAAAPAKPSEFTTAAFTFGGAGKTDASPMAMSTTPSFGTPSTSAPASNSIFGSGAAANTPMFGDFSANNAPAFGASATFGGAGSSAPTNTGSGMFGQSSVSVFGAQQAPSGSTFGSAPATFGAAPAATAVGNPFGGPASPSGDEPQAKKAFEFGTSSSSVNSQTVSPFQFGAGGGNNNDSNAKPFSFSAHSAPNFNFSAGSNAGQTRHKLVWPGPATAAAPTQENPRHKTYNATVEGRRSYRTAAASATAARPPTRTNHTNLVWTKNGQNSSSNSSNGSSNSRSIIKGNNSHNSTSTITTTIAITNDNNRTTNHNRSGHHRTGTMTLTGTESTASTSLPPPPIYDKSRYRYVSPELKRKHQQQQVGNGNQLFPTTTTILGSQKKPSDGDGEHI